MIEPSKSSRLQEKNRIAIIFHLQADDPVPGVVEGVPLPHLDLLPLEGEGYVGHREAVQVPGDLRAGVLDAVLGGVLLKEEVRRVGVALEGLLVDVEALGEPGMGGKIGFLIVFTHVCQKIPLCMVNWWIENKMSQNLL